MTEWSKGLILAFLTLAISSLVICQTDDSHPIAPNLSSANWKEYSFSEYGFAISLPEAPKESGIKDGKQYRLYWNGSYDAAESIVLNLRTQHSRTDCAAWLADIRKRLSETPHAPFPLSDPPGGVHWADYEVTIDGKPAIEGDAPRNALQAGYQRMQCLDDRVYNFEAGFPKRTTKPEIIDQILKTFHLIAKEAKN